MKKWNGYHIPFPVNAGKVRKASKQIFGMDFDSEFETVPQEKLLDQVFFEKLFARAIRISEQYEVPIYCGEYGVIDKADAESTLNWYHAIHEVLEKYAIGRCAWTYKMMDFGIVTSHYETIQDELLRLL